MPYWWSTRLFLLAALADDYSNIKQLVFVENDDERSYVGMATPAAVRKAWGRRRRAQRMRASYHRRKGTEPFLGFYDVHADCLSGVFRRRKAGGRRERRLATPASVRAAPAAGRHHG